jgi:hypothetical protein
MGDKIQHPLKFAIEGCAQDRSACVQAIRTFVDECYLLGEPIALRHARSFHRRDRGSARDLAADLLADLTKKLMSEQDHPEHPVLSEFAGAENLGGLAHREFERLAIDAHRREQRHARRMAPQPDTDDGDDLPTRRVDDSGHRDLAVTATEIFIQVLRSRVAARKRLVLFAAGRPRSHSEPFPVGPNELDAEERGCLEQDGLGELLPLIGSNVAGRVATVAGILGTTDNHVTVIRKRAIEDALSGVIARAINDPSTELSRKGAVALLARNLGHLPHCLASGRHVKNLDRSLQPYWPHVRAGFEQPPVSWTEIGVDVEEVPILAPKGTVELICVGLGWE